MHDSIVKKKKKKRHGARMAIVYAATMSERVRGRDPSSSRHRRGRRRSALPKMKGCWTTEVRLANNYRRRREEEEEEEEDKGSTTIKGIGIERDGEGSVVTGGEPDDAGNAQAEESKAAGESEGQEGGGQRGRRAGVDEGPGVGGGR